MKKQMLSLLCAMMVLGAQAQQPGDPVKKALQSPQAPAAAAKADSLRMNKKVIMDTTMQKQDTPKATKRKSNKRKKHTR